jgi:hypothetical protein
MQQVEIRIKGHIERDWSPWIRGLVVTHTTAGETVLTGTVRDRSALYGLLSRLADLGLELNSVKTGGREMKAPEDRSEDPAGPDIQSR